MFLRNMDYVVNTYTASLDFDKTKLEMGGSVACTSRDWGSLKLLIDVSTRVS